MFAFERVQKELRDFHTTDPSKMFSEPGNLWFAAFIFYIPGVGSYDHQGVCL